MTAGAMTLLIFSTALDTPFPIQLQKQACFSARREINMRCETNTRHETSRLADCTAA